MTIRFSCPACCTNLSVADNLAGRKVKCPKCGTPIATPSETVSTAGHQQSAAGNALQAATTETITYRCAFCRETLESDRTLAGGQDTCPSCGKTTIVPQKSTVGAGAFFSKIPKSVYIGGATIVLLGIVSLSLWLVLRDTWERDHEAELRQMSEQSIALLRAGKNEEGVAKYEAMLALVGDRQIDGPQLRQVLADTKRVAEPSQRQLQEQRRQAELKRREVENLAKLRALESQAQAFIVNGDFSSGSDKYQQALDLIRDNQTDNPEFTQAIGRLTTAKQHAQVQLAEKARLAAEEQQRREEAERMSRIRATVSGAAWVTKGGGDSVVVRGLNVYLLRTEVSRDIAAEFIESQALLLLRRAKMLREMADELETKAREGKLDYYYSQVDKDVPRWKESVKERRGESDRLETTAKTVREKTGRLPKNVPVDELYKIGVAVTASIHPILLNVGITLGDSESWATVVAKALVDKATANVDGKYAIGNVAGGNYLVYAFSKTAFYEIEWLTPIAVKNDAASLDLRNENAISIFNSPK